MVKLKMQERRLAGFQSIERMMDVLAAVAASGDAGARLADVVTATELNRATTYRFLKALQATGMLDHEEQTGCYFIGIKVAELAQAASRRFALPTRTETDLRSLADTTGDTVYLTARVGSEAVCIARHEGSFPIRTLTLEVGDRRPLGIGAGSLALLAFMPAHDQVSIIKSSGSEYARFKLTGDDVLKMVQQAERLGYALNDGRIIEGMSAVALPICNTAGVPVAAITVAAISPRMEEPRRQRIVEKLRLVQRTIEAACGPILERMGSPIKRDV